MVRSVGIGMVEIERLQRVVDRRSSWLGRWFSLAELERARGKARMAEELSGRFACKLAVRTALKALIPHGHPIHLRAIQTRNDPLGKPFVQFEVALASAVPAGVVVHVSITHSRQQAAAVAILEVRSITRELETPGESVHCG